MRCILFGHSMRTYGGAGEYAGQQYLVCTECGKTEKADSRDTALYHVNWFELAAEDDYRKALG